MKVFLGLGFKLSQTAKADISAIPEGPGIFTVNSPHPDGTLILDKGTVYLISQNQRLPFPSEAVFKSWGYDFKNLVKANSFDLNLAVGDVIQMKP